MNNGPTDSCTHLIGRDYELEWIGTNLHFLGGLAGFGVMVGLRLWISNPPAKGDGRMSTVAKVVICWTAATITMGMSIVNRGIAQGDGAGENFGANVGTLGIRYLQLLSQNTRGFLSLVSAAFLVLSFGILIRAMLKASLPVINSRARSSSE